MSSLGKFQRDFAADLLDGTTRSGFAAAASFAVYRNTWRKALIDALRANYPVVEALVGPEAFRALAAPYVSAASASPILAGFGEGFPDHLAHHPVAAELPYLADVARIDRLTTESHLAGEDLPYIAVPSADRSGSIALHPALRFAWLETPAATIWLAHLAPEGFAELAPEWVGEGVLATRPDGAVQVCRIDLATFLLLRFMRDGVGIEAAKAATLREMPGADFGAALALLDRPGVAALSRRIEP